MKTSSVSAFFDPKQPVRSRSGGYSRRTSTSAYRGKDKKSDKKPASYVKRVVVVRAFESGEETFTKSSESILIDGQFTFSSPDSEDNIKNRVIDIMKSADSNFAELETSDLRFDVAILHDTCTLDTYLLANYNCGCSFN